MYNRRSHSPNTSSPTAALLAGFGLRPKRKASAHNSSKDPRPRKTPRQDSENSKSDDDMHPASLFDEDGSNMAADNEDPDLEEIGRNGGWPVNNNEDTGSINEVANNEDPDAIDERSDVGDRDWDGGPEGANNREKFRLTTTIATRGRVAATNSGLKLAHAATVSKVHKPFIPLDFEAIRLGFLEGGVKSTDGKSTTSMCPSISI